MLVAINLFLTLVWVGLFGTFDVPTIASGFLLSYFFLWVIYRSKDSTPAYFTKPPKILSFLAYYLKELVISNFVIARDILTPKDYMAPGVIAVPIRAETDFELTLLANLITMTPGTLSLDFSPDRKTLYVHAMYIHDADALRNDITNNLERRVLEIVR